MIKLTNRTKTNKAGVEVDDSIYIAKYDSRNLCLCKLRPPRKGSFTDSATKDVIGYYPAVATLLKHSIDLVVRDSPDFNTLQEMQERLTATLNRIDEICSDMPTMQSIMREG